MKVLMVATWYSPKDAPVMTAGVFHYEQSMALKPYCETALYFPYDNTLTVPFEKGEEKGLLTYRRKNAVSPIPGMAGILRDIHLYRDLQKICDEFHPDVIHAHCVYKTGAIAARFGKKHHIPVVITEHNPMEQLPVGSKLKRRILHYGYSRSDANVCVSRNSMERLQEQFPDCRYQVIFNGVCDPSRIPPDNKHYRAE